MPQSMDFVSNHRWPTGNVPELLVMPALLYNKLGLSTGKLEKRSRHCVYKQKLCKRRGGRNSRDRSSCSRRSNILQCYCQPLKFQLSWKTNQYLSLHPKLSVKIHCSLFKFLSQFKYFVTLQKTH